MTPTERAKRSDALYYETVSVTRRVLCDMVANREGDIDDLRESVKRLMTHRDERLAKAESENAKLRELVRDMWEGYNDPRCEECHLKDTPTCADCPICAREASVIDRIRELGVEVTS